MSYRPKTAIDTRPSAASWLTRALLFFIRVYQYLLSPYFGTQCRFVPSCSHYAVEALGKYGTIRGSGLAVRRLCRCHPWRPGGFDPVP